MFTRFIKYLDKTSAAPRFFSRFFISRKHSGLSMYSISLFWPFTILASLHSVVCKTRWTHHAPHKSYACTFRLGSRNKMTLRHSGLPVVHRRTGNYFLQGPIVISREIPQNFREACRCSQCSEITGKHGRLAAQNIY